MIVFNLCCDKEHLFEGWFASASAFEAQCDQAQVSCPVCNSTVITRRPTAPYVNTGTASKPPATTSTAVSGSPPSPEMMAAMMAMLRKAGKASEDVGDRFPDEARRIHYGESESRSIKGKATRDDLGELLEEGIMVLPLPPDETDLH